VPDHYDGGELLIDALNAAGVEHVFSSPGSEWAPAWEAFARRQAEGAPAPRYYDLTHETVAVAMATGYGLVTRRPQCVLLHAGPGLLQGANAIHGALLAGAGMVVASSESTTYGEGDGPDPGGQWYRNLSVVGGPHGFAAPWTKWANQVGSVDTLYWSVTRAVETAERQPAGPVYLNVPLEVLLEPTSPPAGDWAKPSRGRRVATPPEVAEVAGLIAAAERPVVITETVGREEGGFEALVRFAEAVGAGVVEPTSAVCANFPKDHPLHLGGELGAAVDEADLILLVNCRAPFYPPSSRPPKARIVVIDEVPQRPHIVYQVLHASAYLEGGVPETLDALATASAQLPGSAERVATRAAWVERHRAAWTAQTDAIIEKATGMADRIEPARLAVKLREIVEREDGVVVDETITHSRAVQRFLGWRAPDSYFYVQGGLGQGMGWALGVKLAIGDRLAVLTIGDGSYLYNPIVQSLLASKDLGLPLLVVVFNNRQYLSMKMNHLRFYPEGAAVATGNHLGVDLSSQPDLAAFAEPLGMHHETVVDPARLDAALEEAAAAVKGGTTAVVNVMLAR